MVTCNLSGAVLNIRCVNNQSVPLPFDVLLGGLLGDIQAIKLQLSRNFFLPLEDHQRYLSSDAPLICA